MRGQTATLPGLQFRTASDGQVVPYQDGRRVSWAPQAGSQVHFLNCPLTEVLYEGNRGPGKTDALLMDFAQEVGRGWGVDWTGIIFRKTYPDLQDVISKSQKWFRQTHPGARFNEQNSTWRFPGGEVLKFRQFAKPSDYWKYHGHAYPFIGWEELVNYADDRCYRSMFSCLRSSRPGMPRKVRSTCNPYGVGHNWVKARWRLPVSPGSALGPMIVREHDGRPCTPRIAVHGHLDENLILLHAEPDYKQKIADAARSPGELAAWLDGSWDIVAGGMFDDIWLRLRDQIVVRPFEPPASWRVDRALDWGSSRPCSVGWYAESDGTDYVDADGRSRPSVRGDLFRVSEIYTWIGQPNEGSRIHADALSKLIVQRELARGWRERVRPGPADSSIFDEENGRSIDMDLRRDVVIDGVTHDGARFVPADKGPGSRKQGWLQVRKALDGCERPESGARERPGLFVFDTCAQWLRTVPTLPRDEDDPDDVDTDAEDHCGDETRYRLRRVLRVAGNIKARGP